MLMLLLSSCRLLELFDLLSSPRVQTVWTKEWAKDGISAAPNKQHKQHGIVVSLLRVAGAAGSTIVCRLLVSSGESYS